MSAFQICNKFDAMTSFDDVMTKKRIFHDMLLIYLFVFYLFIYLFGTHNGQGQGQRSRQDFSFYERFFSRLYVCVFVHTVFSLCRHQFQADFFLSYLVRWLRGRSAICSLQKFYKRSKVKVKVIEIKNFTKSCKFFTVKKNKQVDYRLVFHLTSPPYLMSKYEFCHIYENRKTLNRTEQERCRNYFGI